MSNELYHFGVKGMHWGVRHDRKSLSKEDKRYDKLAKKDAKEYARAKMFYGEGAGTRRKLIKNTVAQRRKENAHYNKAFDMYLSEQDMAKHVGAAKRERKAKNAANFGHRVAKKAFNAATSTPYILMSDVNDSYLGGEQMNNELYHFGVRGMKWGLRRYQNQDGSYTAQGRGRYAPNGSSRSSSRSSSGSRSRGASTDRRARLKRAAKIGAGVAAAGLAAYGGYRLAKSGKLNGLKALPNKRLALPGPKTSKVRNAASRAKSVARGAASKVGNSGVGRRVKRGVNSAQYHATRIKNEMAYRKATARRSAGVAGPALSGPVYSKAGMAAYGVRRGASTVASGARRFVSAAPRVAKRAAGAPDRMVMRGLNWANKAKTKPGRFARAYAVGTAIGAVPVAATAAVAAHQGRKANRRYRNSGKNRRR